jgi:hypothetical protein
MENAEIRGMWSKGEFHLERSIVGLTVLLHAAVPDLHLIYIRSEPPPLTGGSVSTNGSYSIFDGRISQ